MKIVLFPIKLIAALLLFIISLILQIIGAFISFISTVLGIIATFLAVVLCIDAVVFTIGLLFNWGYDPMIVVIMWIVAFVWCSTLFWGIKVGEWVTRLGLSIKERAKSLITK